MVDIISSNPAILLGIILLSFFINLIITLILRASDKKDRSLKNVTARIASFRNEVKTSSDRVVATAKDCEQMVSARIEEAQSTIDNVAASLDILKVHQTELNALDSVCRNYRIALEKLKAQTEQAEARIQAVQKEVRAAEEVHDFVQQFQEDTEKLANRLQDIKTEYVRLVASTEEGLKKAAVKQKEDNDEMLSQFAVAIERYKSQLAEFVAGEKTGFAEECERQEDILRDGTASLENKKAEISAVLEEEKSNLEEFRSKIAEERSNLESQFESDKEKHDADLAALEEARGQIKSDSESALSVFSDSLHSLVSAKSNEISSAVEALKADADEKKAEIENRISVLEAEIDERFNEAKSHLDSEIAEASDSSAKMCENAALRLKEDYDKFSLDLSALLEKRRDDLNSIIAEYNRAMAETKNNGENAMSQLEEREGNLESKLEALISDVQREGEEKLRKINEDAENSRVNLRLSLDESYQEVVRTSKEQLDRIKNDGVSIAAELADQIIEHKETISLLNEGTNNRISEAVDHLNTLKDSIKSNEEKLSSVCQEITVKKQDLYKIYQDRIDAEAELELVKGEAIKLETEAKNFKSQRINEEATLVRLRSQQEVLKKSEARGEDAESRNEDKSPDSDAPVKPDVPVSDSSEKKKPEDMIEAFPDDIFIGDEENIDLSDED